METAGFRIQRPASTLVRDRASFAFGLLRSVTSSRLSLEEPPPSVRVRTPAPENARSPVAAKTKAALLALPAELKELPKVPLELMRPLPASVNRRSMLTEGV